MDYARIYRELIVDRQRRGDPIGYSERHHILPKCMGGSDAADNIIRLTPEDHYFAHLLLAKAHGGALWGGVYCMAQMVIPATEPRRLIRGRYMVGVARRKFAIHQSDRMAGSKAPHKERRGTLYNVDGRAVTGTRTELALVTGVSIASVSRLCTGAQACSSNGWFADRRSYDAAVTAKQEQGRKHSANVAGINARTVVRLECGTAYTSLSEAASTFGTHTSNIARAIRRDGRAAGSRWSYAA